MEISKVFLISLLITVFIEALFLYGCTKILKQKNNFLNILVISFFASGFTLPYIWFVFSVLPSFGFIYGEIFAVIIESIIYFYVLKISFPYSFLFSLGVNIVSFFLGKYILEFIILVR